MADITFTVITWTDGDIITESKLDSMLANDRAIDAMEQGIRMVERADPDTPPANNLHIYAKVNSGVAQITVIDESGTIYALVEDQPAFLAPIAGTLVTGNSLTPILPVPRALTIVKAYAVVKTAPVGASIIIDINKNGTSIWNSTPNNRLTIADGAFSGHQTSFDTTTLAEDDSITIDIDQIGLTTPGADITIYLRCKVI